MIFSDSKYYELTRKHSTVVSCPECGNPVFIWEFVRRRDSKTFFNISCDYSVSDCSDDCGTMNHSTIESAKEEYNSNIMKSFYRDDENVQRVIDETLTEEQKEQLELANNIINSVYDSLTIKYLK